MIFILSDENTIHCVKSLDELEKIYLKKAEDCYKMVFAGIGERVPGGGGKELVINLGQVEYEFAWHLLHNNVLQALSGVNVSGQPESQRTVWPNTQGHILIQLF